MPGTVRARTDRAQNGRGGMHELPPLKERVGDVPQSYIYLRATGKWCRENRKKFGRRWERKREAVAATRMGDGRKALKALPKLALPAAQLRSKPCHDNLRAVQWQLVPC